LLPELLFRGSKDDAFYTVAKIAQLQKKISAHFVIDNQPSNAEKLHTVQKSVQFGAVDL